MKQLSVDQVSDYLRELRKLGQTAPLTDLHVHATEVIFDEQIYHQSAPGLYSVEGADYSPPKITNIRLEMPELKANQETLNRISKLAFSRAYQHVGPKVFEDQMSICGISQAVLLPVSRIGLNFERQWQYNQSFTEQSTALKLGYCIPTSVPTSSIYQHLKDVIDRFNIVLLKIHPNLSCIDLDGTAGLERVEAMLEACGALSIPCLIHGGCSPILHKAPQSNHAIMPSLAKVDWSLCRTPVIIAHFGAYGCQPTDIDNKAVKQLNEALDKYENLYTDTSGIPYALLMKAIGQIDPSRIVFGSDAMYVPMWQGLVSLAHALHMQKGAFEEDILRFTYHNAQNILNNKTS